MAYQPFIITGGSGGYSRLNSPATRSGTVTCLAGYCYVRLLQTATVTASGANADIVGPSGSGYEDGWCQIAEGDVLAFGQEIVDGATQSITEPVIQIDVYIPEDAEVSCLQH